MATKTGSTREGSAIFSLDDQLAFYGSYNVNDINRAIHFACIWPVLWTTLALMTQIPIGKLPHQVLEWLPLKEEAWDLHIGAPLVLVYVIVYCVMDPFFGGLASLLIFASYATANLWMAGGGSVVLAGGVNVAGWLLMFYGNLVHEGRQPAMVANPLRALLAAPLFPVSMVMFGLGFKPALCRQLQARAALNSGGFQVADTVTKTVKMT